MRTDDYQNAYRLAAAELANKDFAQVAEAAGAAVLTAPPGFQLDFFGRPALVAAPEMTVTWRDPKPGEEFSLTDAVLILHYLNGASGVRPTGRFTAYRQISGGEFYAPVFHRRAEIPLAKTFGRAPGLLARAIRALGGEPAPDLGGEAARFRVLPHLDLAVLVHPADEEFESSGQVFFDPIIGTYLPSEDIAWLGSALVYRLMAAAKDPAPRETR